MTHTQCSHTLYGLNTDNCCSKNDTSEKVVNSLLPVSYLIYANDNNIDVHMLSKNFFTVQAPYLVGNNYISTEARWIQPQFINSPPHDVCLERENSKVYFESKIVMFKGKKTELILRQDCFALNVLQVILRVFLH